MNRCNTLALLFSGLLALRLAHDRHLRPEAAPAPLHLPFSELPMDLLGDGWRGSDLPLADDVLRRASVDAYVNREYRRGADRLWLYVGYVRGFKPESIHHPKICFPSAGREQAAPEVQRVIPVPGMAPPPVFNEYQWRNTLTGEIDNYTLSAFYYNGKFETDELRLRFDRTFSIRYFAVITLSGSFTGDLEETRSHYSRLLARVLPPLIRHFPPSPGRSRTGRQLNEKRKP